MKLNFTMFNSRPILALGVLALFINGLSAQNIANFEQIQKNSFSYGSEGISSQKTRDIFKQDLNSGFVRIPGKNLSGNVLAAKGLSGKEMGSVMNPLNTDPQGFQFDLSQNDLGNLYKLLALYKSEAAKGNSIILIRQKKNAGQMYDSIYIAQKYVVSDDLSGFTSSSSNYTDIPNLIVPTIIYNYNGSNQSVSVKKIEAPSENIAALPEINSQDLSGLVSLYPNPTRDEINIDLGHVKVNRITIYSMQGNLVKSIATDLNSSVQKINVADLASGFYVVNISSSTGNVSKKFSKIN